MKPEEIQKLSDRELLVKTYGDVAWLKGVIGGDNGLLGDVRNLKRTSISRKELMLSISIISVILVGIGLLLHFAG